MRSGIQAALEKLRDDENKRTTEREYVLRMKRNIRFCFISCIFDHCRHSRILVKSFINKRCGKFTCEWFLHRGGFSDKLKSRFFERGAAAK